MLKWSKVQNSNNKMSEPQPRLCHVRKRPDFNGYGFNLHTEKDKLGQLIGKIDGNSPAEDAGLKEGDKIIEINEAHVGQENHNQVVERIKSGGGETRLLVVDKQCLAWHKEKGVIVTGSLSYILHLSSVKSETSSESSEVDNVERKEATNTIVEEEEEEDEQSSSSDEEIVPPAPRAPPPESDDDDDEGNESEDGGSTVRMSKQTSSNSSTSSSDSEDEKPQMRPPSVMMTSNNRTSYNKDELVAGLHLNMTAKEMRQRVSTHKKFDPRVEPMNMKEKKKMFKDL